MHASYKKLNRVALLVLDLVLDTDKQPISDIGETMVNLLLVVLTKF